MLEAAEKRKRRDPEIRVWDRFVRLHHWLLVVVFATLYLVSGKFPLHSYAGYLVSILLVARIAWGFIGKGAARFSNFRFTPGQTLSYLRGALQGRAAYHFSHNPLGAAMVYALLVTLVINCLLGMLAYSASQQLGPFGDRIPDGWEDTLILIHAWSGHLIAVLVLLHLLGVLWAARLHRENYILAMLTGRRRIPRAVPLPSGARHPDTPGLISRRLQRPLEWLNFSHPFAGSLLLLILIVLGIVLPLVSYLSTLNPRLLAY
jgi:cytochrome b